jgi:hypothetical protein
VAEHAIPKGAILGVYLPCRNCLVLPWFAFGSAIGHNLTIFGSGFHFRITEYLSEFTQQTAGGYNMHTYVLAIL